MPSLLHSLLLLLLVLRPASGTRYTLAAACGCQCTQRLPKGATKGGNCKAAYKGRLWCYVEDINGSVYCKDAVQSRNYSGVYWSYDACFTPARGDQLCQLVADSGKTQCSRHSGQGSRKIMQCPVTASTAMARVVEPTATMFCSQLPLSQAKRGSGSNLPVINDQITTTDSEGVRWFCNKSCFYSGDVGGSRAAPTCFFPPTSQTKKTSSNSAYDSLAAVEVLDKKTSQSGRDCSWQHRASIWTCSLKTL